MYMHDIVLQSIFFVPLYTQALHILYLLFCNEACTEYINKPDGWELAVFGNTYLMHVHAVVW